MDTSANEPGNMVAIVEELSPVAKIRLELAAMDAAYDLHEASNTEIDRYRFEAAMFYVHLNLANKLHTLLDTIDSQQRQLDILKQGVASVSQTVKHIAKQAEQGEWGGNEISFQLHAEMRRLEMFKS